MFRGSYWLETNKRNLHGTNQPQDVESCVGRVDAMRETTHEQQGKNVQGDEVNDVYVATPCAHHVKVRQGCHRRPKQTSGLH